jgi:Flp pilus assembly protein TadG
MKNRLLKLLGHYRRNETGIAAVEFALVSPILFMLLLGGTEVGRYILVHQKVEKMAYSVADIISQLEAVTSGDVDVVFGAATELMNPYDEYETRGTLYLSSVHKDPDNADQTIRWQCQGGGSMTAESGVGDPTTGGAVAVLPGSLDLEDDDNVIVAEAFYTYRPVLSWYAIQNITISKSAMFRPRLGALTSAPGCPTGV